MMHQIITDPERVATVINSVGTEGSIYQIIPFRRYDTDLFLILWEDHYSTGSMAYGDKDEPYCMGARELESCNCGGNKKKCNHCD